MGECVNQTGFSCTNERCECHGIEPKPMESVMDIATFQKGVVLEVLQRGTIKRSQLLSALPFYISDRKMRNYVAELITDGECIQSSNDGYSLIQTREQLDKAMEYLNLKAKAISIRKNSLLKNYNLSHKNDIVQTSLFD